MDPVDVLSFLVLALVLGVLTLHLLAFTKVPYTALLLVRIPSGTGGFPTLLRLGVTCHEIAGDPLWPCDFS